MAVSREDVLHVARLARLRLETGEVERFTVQLNAILSHVEELAAVDGAGAEEIACAAEGGAPLRDDAAPADPLARPPAALAPEWMDGFYTVPRLAALDVSGPEEPAGGAPPDAGSGPAAPSGSEA